MNLILFKQLLSIDHFGAIVYIISAVFASDKKKGCNFNKCVPPYMEVLFQQTVTRII